MSRPIEDYALLSDCHSAALVAKDGSIDWLAFPCFDSPACFAALLGDSENGRWQISSNNFTRTTRHYIEDTVVLETIFESDQGRIKLTDCMVIGDKDPTLIRKVEGLSGEVDLTGEFIIRFDYGGIVPWVEKNIEHNGLHAVAGPEALVLYSPLKLQGKDYHTYHNFKIHEGESKYFVLMWYQSHVKTPPPVEDPQKLIDQTIDYWKKWSSHSQYQGFDQETVKRSLITLKSLTYQPTGAIVAAATTSLPESLGGERNWDYRYSWIRDSSFTLMALLKGGYKEEAVQWKEWLLRALAGTPSQVNIMYGIRGERRLTEIELNWLKGYENSSPVRIGNKAYSQFQLDVFGELLSTSLLGRKNGIHINDRSWNMEKKMVDYVCEHWQEPDEGIWEVRAERKHFTHSKLMAWEALNCAIENVKLFNLPGDLSKWETLKNKIHQDICSQGYNSKLNSFVQSYGSNELDASLLMMARLGFLPPDDPRILGTIKAIQDNLMHDGLVLRYRPESGVDGLHEVEGCFIPCSFWLVDNLRLTGREEEARELYHYLVSLKNDVGLFAEEYSPKHKRMVGNYPQAFSHIAQAISAMGIESKINTKIVD